MLDQNMNETLRRVPGIGDIPILGYLFRSQAYQKNATELVVMITPHIVRRDSPGVTPNLPGLVQPFLSAPDRRIAAAAARVHEPVSIAASSARRPQRSARRPPRRSSVSPNAPRGVRDTSCRRLRLRRSRPRSRCTGRNVTPDSRRPSATPSKAAELAERRSSGSAPSSAAIQARKDAEAGASATRTKRPKRRRQAKSGEIDAAARRSSRRNATASARAQAAKARNRAPAKREKRAGARAEGRVASARRSSARPPRSWRPSRPPRRRASRRSPTSSRRKRPTATRNCERLVTQYQKLTEGQQHHRRRGDPWHNFQQSSRRAIRTFARRSRRCCARAACRSGSIDEKHASGTWPDLAVVDIRSGSQHVGRGHRAPPGDRGRRRRSSPSPRRPSPIRSSGRCAPAPTSIWRGPIGEPGSTLTDSVPDGAEAHGRSQPSGEGQRAVGRHALVLRRQRRRRHDDAGREHRDRHRAALEAADADRRPSSVRRRGRAVSRRASALHADRRARQPAPHRPGVPARARRAAQVRPRHSRRRRSDRPAGRRTTRRPSNSCCSSSAARTTSSSSTPER